MAGAQDYVAVSFTGDSHDAVSAAQQLRRALKEVEAGAVSSSNTLAAAANRTVAEQAKQVRGSRELLEAYRRQAKIAEQGSAEQVAATRLAEREARRLGETVRTTGQHTSKAFHEGDEALSRFVRGGVAGSEVFSHLGRSIAFASSSFIGGAGLIEGFRASVEQAEQLEKAERGLDAQIRANQQSVEGAAPIIERVNASMARLGHTGVETETALSRLARATGDVTRAANLMQLAADLAAARHIKLEQAAVLVGKIVDGNVSALNRYGIAIAKGTSVTDALQIAQQRLAGQAQASVTPMERLHATVTNLEAKLGQEFLPTLNRIATALSAWLSDTQNQQRVQQTFHDVMETVRNVVHDVSGVIKKADDVTGGLKQTMELLLALAIGTKVARWATSFEELSGAEAAGTGIAGATGKATSLRKALLLLPKQIGIAIGVAIVIESIKDRVHINNWLRDHIPGLARIQDYADKHDPIVHWINQHTGGTPSQMDPHTRVGSVGRRQSPGAAAADSPRRAGAGVPSGGVQQGIVSTAKTALGVPYQYGGAPSLSKPTDCSGLMVAVFAKNGISLPRTSQEQYAQAPIKNARPLLPGDLVFSEGIHPGHVGLYIGNNQVLEDPHTGDHVKIVPLSYFGWNGESARWWGGTKKSADGGVGAGVGVSNQPVAKKKPTHAASATADLVPDTLELPLARAQAQGSKRRPDHSVAGNREVPPRRDLPHEERQEANGALQRTRSSSQDELDALMPDPKKAKDKARKAALADLLPYPLELQLKEARTTSRTDDDLRALRKIDAWLDEQLKHAKSRNRKLALLDEQASVRSEIRSLTAKPKPKVDTNAIALAGGLGALRVALKDAFLSDKEISDLDARFGNVNGRIAKRVKDLLKTATDARSALDSAWGKVRDIIMSALDARYVGAPGAKRSASSAEEARATNIIHAQQAAGRIQSLEGSGMTAAMQQIHDLGQAVVDGLAAVRQAIMGGSNDAVVQAADQLASARVAFDSIAGELSDVEQQYLTAWQGYIEAVTAEGEDLLDKWQADEEQRRKIKVASVGKALGQIYAALRAGKVTWEQAQQDINQLLAPLGLSLADLGDIMDTSALQDALTELKDASKDLATAINGLTAALQQGTTSGGGGTVGGGIGGVKPPIMPDAYAMVAPSALVTADTASPAAAVAAPASLSDHVNEAVGARGRRADDREHAARSEFIRNEMIAWRIGGAATTSFE
jgi:cell wall-associated NlpC family hydrolase